MVLYQTIELFTVLVSCLYGKRILFELEAQHSVGHPGQPLWFYIRFSRALFTNESVAVFYVQVFSNDKNKTVQHCQTIESDQQRLPTELPDGKVIKIKPPLKFRDVRIIQLTIADPGNYSVYVRPNLTRVTDMMKLTHVDITVTRSFHGKECLELASVSINDIDVINNARDVSTIGPDTPTNIRLKFSNLECWMLKKTTHVWSIESIIQSAKRPGFVPRCINNKRVGKVDLSKLMSRLTSISVQVPMNQPSLYIQPYTLTPLTDYRICILLFEEDAERILCTVISTNDSDVNNLMFIITDPPMSGFTWWHTDLIINASRSFFRYELDEAGYIGKKTLSFQWSCTGENRTCLDIRTKQGRWKTSAVVQNDSRIQTTASHILIRREWFRPATRFVISLTLSARHHSKTFSETIEKIIRIPESYAGSYTLPHVFIRCLSNCQYFVNTNFPLQLGFGCRFCEEIISRKLSVTWNSSDLIRLGGSILNATSMYPRFYTKPDQQRSNFRVSLLFQYSQGGRSKVAYASQVFRLPAFDMYTIVTGPDNKSISQPWWLPPEGLISTTTRAPTTTFMELAESSSQIPVTADHTKVNSPHGSTVHDTDDPLVNRHQRTLEKPSQYRKTFINDQVKNRSLTVFHRRRKRHSTSETMRVNSGEEIENAVRFTITYKPHDIKANGLIDVFPVFYCLYFETTDNSSEDDLLSSFTLLTVSSQQFYAMENVKKSLTVRLVSSFGLELYRADIALRSNITNSTPVAVLETLHYYFLSESTDVLYLTYLICTMEYDDVDHTSQIKYIDMAQRHLNDPHYDLVNYSNISVVIFLLGRFLHSLKRLILDNFESAFYKCDRSCYSKWWSADRCRSVDHQPPVRRSHYTDYSNYTAHFLNVIVKIMDILVQHSDHFGLHERDTVLSQLVSLLDNIKFNCHSAYRQSNLKYMQAVSVGAHIFIVLDLILQQCSDMMGGGKPSLRSKIACASFDSSQQYEFTLGDRELACIHINVKEYQLLLNDFSIDPYINIAVYSSPESSLKRYLGDLDINCPVLLISVRQMSPLNYHLNEFVRDIFNIRLRHDVQTSGVERTFAMRLRSGTDIVNRSYVSESECLLLKLNASVLFGTQLFLRSSMSLKYMLTPMVAKYTWETLDIMGRDYQEMPESRVHPNYSLFLPQLSIQNLLSKSVQYYVLIRAKTRQPFHGSDRDYLTIGCAKVTCVRWSSEDKSWSTKNCRPINVSLSQPSYINCRCDTGNIFSGGIQGCSGNMVTSWSDYQVVTTRWDNLNDIQSYYWYLVLIVWTVFFALLAWSLKRDRKDRPLGAVHVQSGVFSPYQSDQYLVCVVTGWMFGAGTSSTPLITLTDNNECGIYLLFPQQDLFQSGSEIWFLLSCPDDVRTLDKVILSFGSANFVDDWHVSHIYMKHLKREEDLYCVCDAWIPDIYNGFRFIVRPVTSNPGSAIRNFVLYVIRMFRTLHVCLGTFYNLPGSKFTKSQHALCLLFTIMLNMFLCVSIGEGGKLVLQGDNRIRIPERNYENFATMFTICVTMTSLVSFAVVVWFEILNYYSLCNIEVRWQHTSDDQRKMMLTVASSDLLAEAGLIYSGVDDVIPSSYSSSLGKSSSAKGSRSDRSDQHHHPRRTRSLSSSNVSQNMMDRPSDSEGTEVEVISPNKSSSGNPTEGKKGHRRARGSKRASRRLSIRKRTLANVESLISASEKAKRPMGTLVDVDSQGQLDTEGSLQDTLSDFMSCLGLDEDLPYHLKYSNFLPPILRWASCLLLVIATLTFSVRVVYVGLDLKDGYRVRLLTWLSLPVALFIIHPILILLVTAMLTKRGLLGNHADAERIIEAITPQLAYNLRFASKPTTLTSRYVPRNRCYFRRKKKTSHRRYCQFFLKKYGGMADSLGIFSVTHFSKRKSQFIFVVIIIIIINIQIGSVSDRYMQTSFVRKLLKIGRNEIILKQSLTVDQVWQYMRRFYLMTFWTLANVNTTSSFYMLSSGRIRQVRVLEDPDSCQYLLPVNDTLYCHFDIEHCAIDTGTYAWTWRRRIQRLASPGPFSHTGGEPFETVKHNYPGGGYDIIFSVSESSPRKIDQIDRRLWVDERTRAIKVDMALFNADTQLLTSISHVFEFTSVGIFQNTIRVFSFPLFYTPATAEFLRMCLFFMLVLTFYFAAKEVVQVRSTGLVVYFSDPLAWLNFLERQTCLAVFIGFVVEIFYRQHAIQNVKNYFSTSEELREYFDFSEVDSIANYITYMCCILAVVSFIKILYQTSTLASMSQFLELIPPAVKISYLVVITVVTYASFGYFIFSEIDDFSTFLKAVYTVTELVINPGLMNSMANSYTIIAPVYITITMSVMNWIIINYFITLLNEEYSRICTTMRMRMEGKKAFVLEEIIKYLSTQKTIVFEAAETRDLPKREDKQSVDKGPVQTLPESDAAAGFDFFEWANDVSI